MAELGTLQEALLNALNRNLNDVDWHEVMTMAQDAHSIASAEEDVAVESMLTAQALYVTLQNGGASFLTHNETSPTDIEQWVEDSIDFMEGEDPGYFGFDGPESYTTFLGNVRLYATEISTHIDNLTN